MTSPVDKKNQETPHKMPPILFPMRRFAVSLQGDGTNASFLGQDDDPDGVQWVGMTPLEMIAGLAEAAEQREVASGKSIKPISVNDTKLSSPTPPVPFLSEAGNGYKKRDATNLATVAEPRNLESQEELPPFDPSYLLTHDSYAGEAVEHMKILARALETMPHYALVKGSYKRIQEHLFGTSNWIHATYAGEMSAQTASEKSQLLYNLYQETIHKMEALVDMTRKVGTEEDDTKVASKPLVKCDFTEYMIQWLKDNWTNPYPDEEGLKRMSRECGVTTTVVSNWLINARTRKWRPAIVKAYELKRPVNLLLEDSINIFDGRPVRELTHYEASQFHEPSTKRRKYR